MIKSNELDEVVKNNSELCTYEVEVIKTITYTIYHRIHYLNTLPQILYYNHIIIVQLMSPKSLKDKDEKIKALIAQSV